MIHAIGNVNHGGEALSDGDLHIYGKLLGRAICGLKGSYASSVYCQYFDPSLIGINDHFINVEDYKEQLQRFIGSAVYISYSNTVDPSDVGNNVLKIKVTGSSYVIFRLLE